MLSQRLWRNAFASFTLLRPEILDRVAAEIITTVESFKAQGMLTTDQAVQLIFDVRNERSRISR